jgi:hypothetical protein
VLSQIDALIPCEGNPDLLKTAMMVHNTDGKGIRYLLADCLVAIAALARQDGYSLSVVGETTFDSLRALYGQMNSTP